MQQKIPLEIQCNLQNIGGLRGLKKGLSKRKAIKDAARIGLGIADETRIKILRLLQYQPLCVCVIKNVLNMSDSKLSYHLSILLESGLISKKKERKFIIYSLTKSGQKIVKCVLPNK